MRIISKLVEIESDLPVNNDFIEAELHKRNIYPLRWAVVETNENTLKISLACEFL